MPEAGFSYRVRKGEEVAVYWRGREVTLLRGVNAARFLERVRAGDAQLEMARVTGNFKRGNER